MFHPELHKTAATYGVPPKQTQQYVPKTHPTVDPQHHPNTVLSGAPPLPPVPQPPTDPSSSIGPLIPDVDVPVLPASAPINLVPHAPALPADTLVTKKIGFTPTVVEFVSPPHSPVASDTPQISDSEEENIIVEEAPVHPSLELQVSTNPLFSSLTRDDLAVGYNREHRHSFPFQSEEKFARPSSSTRDEIFAQLKDFSSHLRILSIVHSQTIRRLLCQPTLTHLICRY